MPHAGEFARTDAPLAEYGHDAEQMPLGTPPATADESEPFSGTTSEVTEGPLVEKWLRVRQAIDEERAVLVLCRTSPALCPSVAAFEFLSMIERAQMRDGLARVGEINRAINLAIRPAEDVETSGAEDEWSSPLATLSRHTGDCEDYAIAKFVALTEAGMEAKDLRLVILRHEVSQEDHAVMLVRIGNGWRVLDNRGFAMRDASQYGRFRPLFSIGANGVRSYDQLPLMSAVQSRPAGGV